MTAFLGWVGGGSGGGSSVAWGVITGSLPNQTDLLAALNASSVGYNVLYYGLVADGVTDNATALNTLLNTTAPSGATIFFPPGNYLVSSSISISNKQFNLVGSFASITTAANTQILNISSTVSSASRWKVTNLGFSGSSSGTNQYAFYFSGKSGGFTINDCLFTNFGGGGIAVGSTEDSASLGGIINACSFFTNNIGVNSLTRGEYVQITSNQFVANTTGILSVAGNIQIVGNNISYNTTGIEIGTGTNDAHGIISSNNINHNVTWGLNIHDVANGMTIANNHIYVNNIRVKDTTGGIIFDGGKIDAASYVFDTNVGLVLRNISFPNSQANVVTLTGAAPSYEGCRALNGDLALSPTIFLTGIKNNFGTYTPALTNVANLDASTAFVCQWSIQGRTVTVSGKVSIDPTLAATSTQLGIALPIPSNFANDNECAGAAFASAIAAQGAAILADATNNRAQLQFISGDITNQPMFFTFTYQII